MNRTYIEGFLEPASAVKVPCQTDNEYSEISSNQCSWVAAEFAQNHNSLIKAYKENRAQFIEMYTQHLLSGSINRERFGGISCGENVDNELVHCETGIDKSIKGKYTYTENKYVLDMLSHSIPPTILTEFCGRIHTQLDILELDNSARYILLSRHGQSFIAIPLDGKYLVLDSHTTVCGLMTEHNLKTYIKMEHVSNILNMPNADCGYIHVILIYG